MLKALPWDGAVWKSIIEELHSRKELPPVELNHPYRDTVYDMINMYATMVSINGMGSGYDYPYYNASRNASSTFAFCFSMGGPASLQIVIQRALQKSLGSSYGITNELVPLLGELVSMAQTSGLSPSQEPFASTIKKILLAWISLVLGPRPSKHIPMSTIQAIVARSTCKCQECLQVKGFLLGNTESITLSRIGAPKRRHVEQELSIPNIRELVTHRTIGRSPQGLEV
jgi:hypothetical protein